MRSGFAYGEPLLLKLRIYDALCASYIRRGIEVVITGLTRNQFARNRTRVRIPPSPPKIGLLRQVDFFVSAGHSIIYAMPYLYSPPYGYNRTMLRQMANEVLAMLGMKSPSAESRNITTPQGITSLICAADLHCYLCFHVNASLIFRLSIFTSYPPWECIRCQA